MERNQIEEVLGLTGLVSLTDHDTISAPTLLRVVEETSRIPFALEWSVPFEGAVLSRRDFDVEVTRQAIRLPRLPKAFEGFRIVQLSDLHISLLEAERSTGAGEGWRKFPPPDSHRK